MKKIDRTNTQTIFISLILLAFVFVVVVGSASAANVTVGTAISSGVHHDNIKDAVNNDNVGNKDVITIMAGNYKGQNNRNITINKNITLQSAAYTNKGAGKTIIDAENNGHIFTIAPDVTVNIYGITFKNSLNRRDDNTQYGAISNDGILNIKNSEFINNRLAVEDNGKMTITSCNFTSNGVSLSLASEEALVRGCNFIANGYAIEVLSTGMNNNINYNRFVNNSFDISGLGFNTNLDYNWWGSNSGFVNGNGYVKTIHFIVQLSADNIVATANKVASYRGGDMAGLTYGLTTNSPVSFEYGILPSFNVSLTLPNGRIINWNSNSGYGYALTGFRSQNFLFKVNADLTTIALTINFVDGISPSIQPTSGTELFYDLLADTEGFNYNPLMAGEPDSENLNNANTPTSGSNDSDSSKNIGNQGANTNSNNYNQNKGVINKNSNDSTSNTYDLDVCQTQAAMKETGIPFIGLLLGILSIVGVFVRRN